MLRSLLALPCMAPMTNVRFTFVISTICSLGAMVGLIVTTTNPHYHGLPRPSLLMGGIPTAQSTQHGPALYTNTAITRPDTGPATLDQQHWNDWVTSTGRALGQQHRGEQHGHKANTPAHRYNVSTLTRQLRTTTNGDSLHFDHEAWLPPIPPHWPQRPPNGPTTFAQNMHYYNSTGCHTPES